jgi:uncharacterized protein YkwD
MVVNNYFSHTTPTGEVVSVRALAWGFVVPGKGFQLGENLAWGTRNLSAPGSIVTSWMASPEHRANILDPAYRETGMSIVPAAPGATYTQEFGVVG